MDKINKLDLLKGVAELAVSMGVSVVVGNLIKETTPYNANKFQKVLISIGGYSLGGLLGDMAGKRIVEQVDDLASRLNLAINPQEKDTIVVQEKSEDQEQN